MNRNDRRAHFPSSLRTVVGAVATAWIGLASSAAQAGSSCVGGGTAQTVSGADTTTCNLANGDSVTVTATGTIGTLASPVTNNGISANAAGITVTNINIQGTISASGNGTIGGILIGNSASVSGSITNSGTINATTANGFVVGINLFTSNVVSGNITNSGHISASATGGGESTGILLSSTSSAHAISNSGSISSTATTGNATGIAIDFHSTVPGGISNSSSGVISAVTGSGTATGIFVTSSASVGAITNSGTISAKSTSGSGDGIRVVPSGRIASIDNSGTIKGSTLSLDLLNTGGAFTITNSGTLSGAVFLGINTLNVTGSSAQIIGAVTGSAGSTINVNGALTAGGNFQSDNFGIGAGGALHLNGGQSITSTNGVTNVGVLGVGAGSKATITGNYTQAASGVLDIGVGSVTNFGSLDVSGTANLASGNKLNVTVSPGAVVPNGSVLAAVLQANTLTLGAPIVVTDNSALFSFTAVRNGNEIDLDVKSTGSIRSDVIAAGNTAGVGAATVLDGLNAGTVVPAATADMVTVLGAISALGSANQISGAVRQMLPLLDGDLEQVAVAAQRNTNHIVEARQQSSYGLSTGDGIAVDRDLWIRPFGSWANQDDRDGVTGWSSHTYGLALGADTALSSTDRLGVAFFYGRTDADGNPSGATQSAHIDSYQAALYGSRQVNAGGINFQVDLGHNDNDGHRGIDFGTIDRVANSSFTSSTVHVGAGVDQAYSLGQNSALIPSVRLDYTTVNSDSYRESGAGALDFQVGQNKARELLLAASGKYLYVLDASRSLYANFGVGYDFLANRNPSIDAFFIGGGPNFSTPGIDPKPWVIRGGVGFLMHTSHAVDIALRYDVEGRDGFTNQTASVTAHVPF